MRNYNDAEYKKFRCIVKKRDGRKCRWPNCNCRKKLHVHHILPWSKYPSLRYDINNGITLCKAHHKVVTGNEILYAPILSGIINGK